MGAVVAPIFQNSLFVFDTHEEYTRSWTAGPHAYSRISNPTNEAVEKKLAKLEGCESAKVFASGMAAISAAILSCVESGSHIVLVDSVYGPTRQFIRYLTKFGVTHTLVDGRDTEELLDALRPETGLVYLESPSSMSMRLQDIRAITQVCREKKVPTALDNSHATPYHQLPAAMGVDIVLHSATKYLGGHSDLLAGVVATSQARIDAMLHAEYALLGGALGPFQAWLLMRGLRTLSLRMAAHQKAGNLVAGWLEARPDVERVYHVGLPSYPQRELALQQMSGTGGLLSWVPRNPSQPWLAAFCDSLELFQLGCSWGGFESLAVVGSVRELGEAPQPAIRLFCGLEDPQDLIEDLDQAFEKAHRTVGPTPP